MTFPIRAALITAVTALSVQIAVAQEVNVYSYRQPELVEPLFDSFTEDTGIKVNVAFLNKGVVEKLEAEGKRSPADLVLTVDVAQLDALIKAGVTQAVDSEAINANIPEAFRDSDGHWFGLSARARIVYASKDRCTTKRRTRADNSVQLGATRRMHPAPCALNPVPYISHVQYEFPE